MVQFRRRFNQFINVLLIVVAVVLLISSDIRTSVASTLQSWVLHTGLLDAEATASAELGSIDQPLALAQLDGTPLDSALLIGKPIFLHIWASWCPPCIAELPDIQQLVNSMSPQETTFLLVSVDKDVSKVRQFVSENQYSLPVYRLTGEFPPELEYNSIPTTYIIAPSGQILYKHEGLAQYNHDDFKQFLLDSH